MYKDNYPKKRYKLTLDFVDQHISKGDEILDLGIINPLSKLLNQRGYKVTNTQGEDLDVNFDSVEKSNAEVISAF